MCFHFSDCKMKVTNDKLQRETFSVSEFLVFELYVTTYNFLAFCSVVKLSQVIITRLSLCFVFV